MLGEKSTKNSRTSDAGILSCLCSRSVITSTVFLLSSGSTEPMARRTANAVGLFGSG